MGRIIVEQLTSVDGFAADADGGMSFMRFGAQTLRDDREQTAMLAGVDAIVLGRTTYTMFADYWPTADPVAEPVAELINTLPKHVVSSTLDRAPWGDGEIAVERDGVDAVRRLASSYAKDVLVWGSLALTDALFRARAVDVLRLRLVPGLIGAGRAVTPSDLEPVAVELEKTEVHAGGVVTLQYGVRA
jgi:dihydrofolate reductase